MHSAHSILACGRWWRTGPCRIPDMQKAVKGAWVQNSHTRCFHFLCSWRPSPLMGNHHQTVKSNTPSNKTLGELVLGSFWDLVTREGAAERQAHLPERTLSCTRSRCYAFSCLHLGGCIWFACERRVRVVSRCVGKLHNRLWRRLYTTGIALGKMASFTQSTVYHQSLHWHLHLDECWTVLSVWLLALSKVKTDTWKALGVAREVFPQRFSRSPSDPSPHLWEENQSPGQTGKRHLC